MLSLVNIGYNVVDVFKSYLNIFILQRCLTASHYSVLCQTASDEFSPHHFIMHTLHFSQQIIREALS